MIEQRMEKRCRGDYERSFLTEFLEEGDVNYNHLFWQWIEKVIGWLSKVFLQDETSQVSKLKAMSTLKRWRCHVQRFFYRLYASMRIDELFCIIRDFPDSKPAIKDLKYCLERTNQRQELLSSLKSALETRCMASISYFREIRNVELLKLRFGEAQMHYCEVMLKDMADSRRINTNIRDEEEKLPEEERPPFNLVAVILSSEFWPALKEEKLELPEQIKETMDMFTRRYEKLKAMRTLNWKHHLGLVSLDVELADRTLSYSVSPVHAAIILNFQNKSTWTLEELSEVLKVPVASLRRKMTFWLQQGVLREDPQGTFMVIEEEQKDQAEKVVLIDSDEEGDSAMASQADQKEEELQLFWTYIQAMLTNLESLPLERIHSMLKMFVMTGPVVTEIDIQELQGYLQKKVSDQQLVYSGGVYRLPKNSS
ncbi:hypothetical protein AB205_0153560 [Aquarana catesbeiana]|uniref:Anaphase-promoting complex subunit 2 n=1 Tax=Aquarana catesbeiana TaxID=8400 RepID=A0A2G9RKG1_AQUCT|nr:hypothetical protein AB205_0153560 [Aquarana catesbeiana]